MGDSSTRWPRDQLFLNRNRTTIPVVPALPASNWDGIAIFRKLPSDSVQSVLAVFTSQQAMIHGRTVYLLMAPFLRRKNWHPLTEPFLASFIFFDDGDGQSSGKLLRSLAHGFFLNGVDKQILAGKDRSIRIF